MTVYIKKTDSAEEIKRKIDKVLNANRKTKKQFDPFKYLGKLKGVYGDGLAYQKKVRNEWD